VRLLVTGRHSVQAKRDTESSIISKFWIPARVPFRVFAGMTAFMALLAITAQSRRPESRNFYIVANHEKAETRCVSAFLLIGQIFHKKPAWF